MAAAGDAASFASRQKSRRHSKATADIAKVPREMGPRGGMMRRENHIKQEASSWGGGGGKERKKICCNGITTRD